MLANLAIGQSNTYTDNAVAGVVGGAGYFQQAGTGAVNRTYPDKMKEAFSVRDFGAVGNGVANDAPAILAAFAQA